jgi:hypothetical protein
VQDSRIKNAAITSAADVAARAQTVLSEADCSGRCSTSGRFCPHRRQETNPLILARPALEAFVAAQAREPNTAIIPI